MTTVAEVLLNFDVNTTEIALEDQFLTGAIPTSIGSFTSLTHLSFWRNQITGTIPTQIGLLVRLQYLDLADNDLSGEVPSELGNLVKVSLLDVGGQSITGNIPTTLGSIEALSNLRLGDNFLAGSLPTEIGKLTNLEKLWAENNNLNGSVPTEIGNLQKLITIECGLNQLSGAVPSQIGNLVLLQYLGFKFNNLEHLPTEIGLLTELTELNAPENKIINLPSELGSLAKVRLLNLYKNQIEESISSEIGNMASLTEIALYRNNIGGSLPEQITKLQSLFYLNIYDNELTGQIPDLDGFPFLQQVDLHSNKFSGQFPKLPASVVEVKLNENELSGEVSPITNTVNLYSLEIDDNQLTGSLPTLQNNEVYFSAAGNMFDGPIPFAALPESINTLILDRNSFSGTLDDAHLMPNLRFLRLGQNSLQGELPESLSQLSRIRDLELNDNQLSGMLPEFLWRMTTMTSLRLAGNQLEGELSPNMTKLTQLQYLSLGLDNVTCDCNLLTWYPEFIKNGTIVSRENIATCGAINEYEGTYPHLLSSESTAPCSHPIIESVVATSSTITTKWTYVDTTLPTNRANLTAAELTALSNCELFQSADIHNLQEVVGYEVAIKDGKRICIEDEEGSQEFQATLSDLSPYTLHTVTVRTFRLKFRPDKPVAYVFGPRSRQVVIQTGEAVPAGTVSDITMIDRKDSEVRFSWTDVKQEDRNGEIVEYAIHTLRLANNETLPIEYAPNPETVIKNLEPDEDYVVSIQARTSVSSFGPMSDYATIRTCPSNGEWDNSFDEFECYAVVGFFKDSDGQIKDCDSLTENFQSLKQHCSSNHLTVLDLPLNEGFWRPSLQSSELLPCPEGGFCSQARLVEDADVDQYCEANHSGVYCYDCVEGYVPSSSGCIACTGGNAQGAGLVVGIVCLFVILCGLFFIKILYYAKAFERILANRRMQKQQMDSSSNHWSIRSKESLYKTAAALNTYHEEASVNTKLRILFGYLQVFFSYQRTFQYHRLGNGASMLKFLSSFSIEQLLDQFNFRCAYDYSHYEKLLISTIVPLIFLAVLLGLCWVVIVIKKHSKGKLIGEFISTLLLVAFVVYPNVSQTIFETFWCDQFDAVDITRSVLSADFRTTCGNDSNIGWLVYAGFMIVIYPVGVLVLYTGILIFYRTLILKPQKTDRDMNSLRKVSFLISPYDEDTYWFETYELLRKLLQTCLVGFLRNWPEPENHNYLALFSQNLCLLAIIVLVYLQPYKKFSDFCFALVTLLMLLPATQISIVDPYANDDNPEVRQLQVILIVEFILFAAFCIGDFIYTRFTNIRPEYRWQNRRYYARKNHRSDASKPAPFEFNAETPKGDFVKQVADRSGAKEMPGKGGMKSVLVEEEEPNQKDIPVEPNTKTESQEAKEGSATKSPKKGVKFSTQVEMLEDKTMKEDMDVV